MQNFYDLPEKTRFSVYKVIDALQCSTRFGGGGAMLSVAVAKGKFGELVEALKTFGLDQVDLYKFPLGTDKPPMHLRHMSYGQPDSCWLIATFKAV